MARLEGMAPFFRQASKKQFIFKDIKNFVMHNAYIENNNTYRYKL